MKRVLLAAAISASACSPYLYEKEIGQFATATEKFTDGVSGIQASIRDEPRQRAFWHAYARPNGRVELNGVACDAAQTDPAYFCRLRVDGTDHALTDSERELVANLNTLKRVSAYVAALRAVTNAADRAALDAASASLTTAATNLAAIVPNPVAGPLTAVVVRAGTNLLGLFLDRARLRQLRQSVGNVQDRMPGIEVPLAAAMKNLRSYRIISVKDRMRWVDEALAVAKSGGERERLIKELQAGVAQIQAMQASKPGALVEKMVAAHGALAEALENPRVDLSSVAKTLTEFADIAADFNSAFAAQ